MKALSLKLALGFAALLVACSGAETAGELGAPTADLKPMQEPSQPPPAADEQHQVTPLPAPDEKAVDAPVAAPPEDATPAAAAEAPKAAEVAAAPIDIRRPDSAAEPLIQEGIHLIQEFNLFDARQRLQGATQRDPQSATAHYDLALVQYRLGNFDDALQSAHKAVELNPTYARAVVLLSVLHLRRGETHPAGEAVDTALLKRPNDVMLLGAKARVLVAEREFQHALDVCVQAIKLDHDNPELTRYTAEAYLGLNREGLARLALDRAFQIYTGDEDAPTDASGAPTGAGAARKTYEVRTSHGGGTRRGVQSEALDRDAGIAHIYYLYGQMALRRDEISDAREQFLQATKLRSDYAEAWNNLGVTWIIAKKGEEAIDALSKALEIEPTLLEARINLGSAYRISKDPDRAVKAKAEYERAIKQEPRNPAPHFNLGILYLESALPDVASSPEQRFQKSIDYFNAYRDLRGPRKPGEKDPLEDYIAEAVNLRKIASDKRKTDEQAKVEQEADKKKAEEDKRKKDEVAQQKAAEDAKKAEDDQRKADEEARRKADEAPKTEPPAADQPPPIDQPPVDQPPAVQPPPEQPPADQPAPPPPPDKKEEPAPPPPPPADSAPSEPAPPPPPPAGDEAPPPGR